METRRELSQGDVTFAPVPAKARCLHSADARWLRFAAAVCIIGKFLREATKCVKQKMRRRNQIAKTNNRRNCGFHCHIIGLITGISVRLRLCFSVDGKCNFILFAGLFPPLISVVSSLCFMICLPFAPPPLPPSQKGFSLVLRDTSVPLPFSGEGFARQ